MVGKNNKKHMPRQKGLPSQEVSPPRRTESSPSRRSRRRINSPQSGKVENFGDVNDSPNVQSRDSQANHYDTSDSVLPGLVADDDESVEVQFARPDFESSDPFSVLGVPEQATICLIKKTYFKLSKQYHPDRLTLLLNHQDAHTTFTAIANAYELLMDPDRRREHDLTVCSIRTVNNNTTFNVDDEDSFSEEEKVFSKCDWCQIVDCNFPQLKPLKCTVNGCIILSITSVKLNLNEEKGFLRLCR